MPQIVNTKTSLGKGYPIALGSALVLSMTAILIRYLTRNFAIPALVLSVLREILVFVIMLAGLTLIRPTLLKVGKKHLRYLILFGAVLALFNSLWTLSVALNGAAVSTVLAYSSAGFTALLGWWLLKERLDWVKLAAVVASLSGCVLVSGAYERSVWGNNLVGIITGIASGLLYAIYSLMGRSASQRGINPWTTLMYTFGIAAVFLGGFTLLGSGHLPGGINRPADFLWLGDSWLGWGVLLLLAAGPTLVGYGLYNLSLSYLPSSVANLIASSEPAFTVAIAYLFLGETMSLVQVAGSLLILGGVVFLRLHEGYLARKSQTEPTAEGLGVIE